MATVVTFERRGFEAHVLQENDKIVCILTPAAETDSEIQARVRRLMKGQGIDCRMCRGCPVGRAQ
jgi:hypothetical protein